MNGKNTEISDDEEVREPKITSLDPNERKLARRLRIQRRLQKTKQQARVAAAEEVEKDDTRTLLEKQLENSENQLEVLLLEGKELVTNVCIGNDAREVKRREDEVVAREKRLQRLEDEANESVEKFNEVNSKWQVILQLNDPLDLHHSIEEQKVKCAELIAQKDVLIKELRRELKLADERFDKDQHRQKQDLWLLAERIDNQVKVMRKAYKEELKLIEEVIDVEHRQLMEVNNKKWESLYKERERLEVDQMEKKFEAVERHEDEIYRVAVEHQEKFREVKIKLETDIQVLQQELEQVKAQCLMNNEKLVYNYQVLKKREEENLIVRSQQKRRINRLQDVVSTLRKKIAETEKSLQSESARLTDEVLRLHQNIRDIEIKANHFAVVNDRKYHQVWKLNREVAEEKLQKILDIDQILYEQQLGLDWNPPDLTLLQQQDLASYRSAMEVVSDIFQEKGAGAGDMDTELEAWKSPTTREELEERCRSERLLQHILKLVADSSGFLAEQRLKELLKHHSDKEKMLVKLDSVFTALGVKTEADMLMLKDHFLLYATCSMCSAQEESTEMVIAAPDSHEYLSDSTSTGEDTETACMGSAEEDAFSASFSVERAEIFNKDKLIRQICSDKSHTLVIDPVFVLKALRDFVAKLAPVQHGINGGTLASKRSTVSRLLSAQDVTAFWTRFREIFSPEREKLWDGLLLGLQKYHQILEERHILNEETERLRCQNAEFRKLLHFYIQGSENESVFLSSREHLPPITKLRNGSILKNRKKFPKYRHSSGYIRTLSMEEPTIP